VNTIKMTGKNQKDTLKALLGNYELKMGDYLFDNLIEKYALIIGGICIIIATPALYSEPYRTVGGWIYLIAALSFIIYSLPSFLALCSFVPNAADYYVFSRLSKKIDQESEILSKLAYEDKEHLQNMLRHLQFEQSRLKNQIGFLIGAVEKLGIIPALLALYLTYVKTQNDSVLEVVPYQVLSVIVAIYTGCIFLKHITTRIEYFCFILDKAQNTSVKTRSARRLPSIFNKIS
jgi:hypothetical protein